MKLRDIEFGRASRFFRRRREEKEKQHEQERVECHLCQRLFKATTKFHRFCVACKKTSELFRFHESLPSGAT
jgi:hypothetical protein